MVTLGSLVSLCHMEINLAWALLVIGITNHPYTITSQSPQKRAPEWGQSHQAQPSHHLLPFPPLLTLKLNTITDHLLRGPISTALRNPGSSLHRVTVPNPGSVLSVSPTDCYLKAESPKNSFLDIQLPENFNLLTSRSRKRKTHKRKK